MFLILNMTCNTITKNRWLYIISIYTDHKYGLFERIYALSTGGHVERMDASIQTHPAYLRLHLFRVLVPIPSPRVSAATPSPQ